jgi:shikimate dehydrogenase
MLNKDTKIYGSFSIVPGNNGCNFFNSLFEKNGINAIYKPFAITDIEEAIEAAKQLKFSGVAIAAPYKILAYEYVDVLHETALYSVSINTIKFRDNITVGFNTDYLAALQMILPHQSKFTSIYVLGAGGLARAVIAASNNIGYKVNNIVRSNWDDIRDIKDGLIFNCTPVYNTVDSSNIYIDCIIGTPTGNEFFLIQATEQYKIYEP